MEQHEMGTEAGAGLAIDPVCGMTVDLEQAKAAGRVAEHEGETYYFCSRGCLLEFQDNPARFSEPGYTPSM